MSGPVRSSGEPHSPLERLLTPSPALVLILLVLILSGTVGELVMGYLVLTALRP